MQLSHKIEKKKTDFGIVKTTTCMKLERSRKSKKKSSSIKTGWGKSKQFEAQYSQQAGFFLQYETGERNA